jgi:protein transport protein SEC20
VRVGRGQEREEREVAGGEADSMVEKVGRMVEDTLDRREEEEANRTAEDELEDQPNPMKRVWEEEVEEAEQVRDEL